MHYDCHLTEFELGIHTRLLVELDNALTPDTADDAAARGRTFDLPRAVALGRMRLSMAEMWSEKRAIKMPVCCPPKAGLGPATANGQGEVYTTRATTQI
jgi:hypothetical protein